MSDLTVSNPVAPTRTVTSVKPTVSPAIVSAPIANTSSPNQVTAVSLTEISSSGTNVASKEDDVQAQVPVSSGTSGASNILTYRDNDTGKLIIQLIDKDNNAVIAQFPSLTQLGNYPKINNAPTQVSTIDKEI